jgi:mono/diheme cytochrome c family protein
VLTSSERTTFEQGMELYQQICAGCHGAAGEGLTPSAPPLVASEWVLGSEERLIKIVLHGLSGPVDVNGITYQPPAILPEMPPLAALDDAQIAAILTYIRRAWNHAGAPVTAESVRSVRENFHSRQTAWRQEQLLNEE